jgi:hypothetical protein
VDSPANGSTPCIIALSEGEIAEVHVEPNKLFFFILNHNGIVIKKNQYFTGNHKKPVIALSKNRIAEVHCRPLDSTIHFLLLNREGKVIKKGDKSISTNAAHGHLAMTVQPNGDLFVLHKRSIPVCDDALLYDVICSDDGKRISGGKIDKGSYPTITTLRDKSLIEIHQGASSLFYNIFKPK